MTTRLHAYLFNHRLGANARIGESGHVLCHELTLRGILADSLETRWASAPGGGLRFEALVPWRTLRMAAPAAPAELPFRLRIAQPGRDAIRWGDSASMGRIRLVESRAPAGPPAAVAARPLLSAESIRQPETLGVAVPIVGAAGGAGPLDFSLVDAGGEVRRRARGAAGGSAVMARLATARLPDGPYTLRVHRNGATLAARSVRLVGGAAEAQVEEPRARLAQRLAGLRRRAWPAGVSGHLMRAERVLDLAALPPHPDTSHFARSKSLLADAGAILDAVEAGRRPDTAREGDAHAAGFAGDGQRGPVRFVPTTAPRARLTVHAGRPTDWSLTPRLYGTFSEPVVYDRPI